MPSPSDARLRAYAELLVRRGVNLQPGQRLLIADPYELQGVPASVAPLLEALTAAVRDLGCPPPRVLRHEPAALRELARADDVVGFTRHVAENAELMRAHLAHGGAFLFLLGHHPGLLEDLPAARRDALHQLGWEHFGPVVQRLIRAETQWCVAPAPQPAWADAVFADRPAAERLEALWAVVADACRGPDLAAWDAHFTALTAEAGRRNAQRPRAVRYTGPGTDLRVPLPAKHRWCTVGHRTKRGVPFLQNLPTEEIFTAPLARGAGGRLRVARPVAHAGSLLEGVELEFRGGRVVAATATRGAELLATLLATDGGTARLGEVAWVPPGTGLQRAGRCFHHPILDENALPHVALGSAYPFCLDGFFKFGINDSLVHVDLPLETAVDFLTT